MNKSGGEQPYLSESPITELLQLAGLGICKFCTYQQQNCS